MDDIKKNFKAPFQAGVIDIGAHSVRLEIFQVDAKNNNEILEELSQPIDLGSDVFQNGSISPANVNRLCSIMSDFAAKLNEYDVRYCRTVGTSAVREAFNRDMLINRVKISSGLNIKVLEVSEEARMLFLSMREMIETKYDFSAMNALTFALGTGSLIIMLSENGRLKSEETAALGTVRLFDEYGRYALDPDKVIELIESFDIHRRLASAMPKGAPLNLIGLGAGVRALVNLKKKFRKKEIVEMSRDELKEIMDKVHDLSLEQLVEKYNISDRVAMSIVPCWHIIDYFAREMQCGKLIFPALSTRDALVADITRHTRAGNDPFEEDIVSVTQSLGRKYCYEEDHARAVASNSLKIFDKIKKTYALDNRMRLLLHVAALLHDMGRFIDICKHHKHSYYLIINAQLPGISEAEQRMIAAIARYHRKANPKPSHPEYMCLLPEEKVTVCKLSAILRVADALDRGHADKFTNMTVRLKGDELIVKVKNSGDISLESLYLQKKNDMFANVFGLSITIEEEIKKL